MIIVITRMYRIWNIPIYFAIALDLTHFITATYMLLTYDSCGYSRLYIIISFLFAVGFASFNIVMYSTTISDFILPYYIAIGLRCILWSTFGGTILLLYMKDEYRCSQEVQPEMWLYTIISYSYNWFIVIILGCVPFYKKRDVTNIQQQVEGDEQKTNT